MPALRFARSRHRTPQHRPRRIGGVWLFLLIMGLVLSACSAGGTEDVSDGGSPAEQPGETGGEAGGEAPMDEVTVRLDWIVQGPNAGFIIADQMGFYEEENIKVTIGPGEGSGTTAQVIGAKGDDFGFSDGYVVAKAIAEGMPIKMVASIYRQNPTGIIALKETGITRPEDLAGKTVGIPPGSTQAQQWPAYVKGCGLDESSIRVVNVGPAAAVGALLEKQVDAIAGYVQGYAPGVEIGAGQEVDILWYADCDVVAISNGIIVHNDLLESNPDLVRRFVRATVRGFLYGHESPDEAVSFLHKYSDTIEDERARREMEFSWKSWVPDSARGTPLGWMPPEDWEKTLETLAEYGDVSQVPDPEDVYTNEFVPEGEEFIPPQP